MLATIASAALHGIDAEIVHVEVNAGEAGDLLQQAKEQLHLSARVYNRILKVAGTIADLASADTIAAPHRLEAIQYRSLDRTVFY